MQSFVPQHVSNLMCDLPDDGTDVPQHVVAAKDHTFNVCL
jgi:hypothetical protein